MHSPLRSVQAKVALLVFLTQLGIGSLYSQTFSSIGNVPSSVWADTATLLQDGTVLITGEANTSAVIYNPKTKTFAPTKGSMTTVRYGPVTALLSDGTVLIAGGLQGSSTVLTSAELYNPATGTFSPTGSMTA